MTQVVGDDILESFREVIDVAGKEIEASVLKDLSNIQSLDELKNLVGEITPEEKKMLVSLDLYAEPTEEEMRALGPMMSAEAVERLTKRTLAKISETRSSK